MEPEQLDTKLIGKVQRVFNCSEGQDVLEEFSIVAEANIPFGCNSAEQGNYKAGWLDAYQWFKLMIDYKGEDNNE